MSILRALGFDDDEVVVGGGDIDDSFNWKKSSKSKKPLALEQAFILLRLAFADIWIKTEAAYFLGKWPWDALYKTHDAELLAWHRLPRFGDTILKATSRKHNPSSLIIPLCSSAPPGLSRALSCSMLFRSIHSKSIICKRRPTELLALCCVTVRSRQM